MISFDGPIMFGHTNGPSTFATRLALQFQKMGHEIVPCDVPHDIHICFIEPFRSPHKSALRILRLDGIDFRPEDFQANNAGIKRAYQSFDHVVIQSEHDRKMISKWLGTRDGVSVIGNGIEFINRSRSRTDHDLLFVCSAEWHPQKRVADNVKLFRQIEGAENRPCKLIILGDGAQEYAGQNNIDVRGKVSHAECLQVFADADWMINLEWLGHCPNVCIEALSMRCPIIYADSGGLPELVGSNGIMVPDAPYGLELCDYDDPPALDLSGFILPDQRIEVEDIDRLRIENVAARYLEI